MRGWLSGPTHLFVQQLVHGVASASLRILCEAPSQPSLAGLALGRRSHRALALELGCGAIELLAESSSRRIASRCVNEGWQSESWPCAG